MIMTPIIIRRLLAAVILLGLSVTLSSCGGGTTMKISSDFVNDGRPAEYRW